MSVAPQTADGGSLRGEVSVVEPTRHERSVARRSAEIRATVPHAEFSRVLRTDAAREAASPEPAQALARVLAAVAQGLRAVPRLNGAYRDGRFELYSRVNLGVVITAEGIVAVPTVFDTDQKSVNELAIELADLRERALTERLASADLAGATFTVSDLEEHALTGAAPLILGGHAGALAVGARSEVPILTGGAVVPGSERQLWLAVDHRIVQAPEAGRFLATVARELESA